MGSFSTRPSLPLEIKCTVRWIIRCCGRRGPPAAVTRLRHSGFICALMPRSSWHTKHIIPSLSPQKHYPITVHDLDAIWEPFTARVLSKYSHNSGVPRAALRPKSSRALCLHAASTAGHKSILGHNVWSAPLHAARTPGNTLTSRSCSVTAPVHGTGSCWFNIHIEFQHEHLHNKITYVLTL